MKKINYVCFLLLIFNYCDNLFAQLNINDNFNRPKREFSEKNEINNKNVLSKEQKEKFAVAGPEDITNENFPEIIESFDYPNADIQDIIKAISELTGKNFIIDDGIRGRKITIIAPSKITVAEAYKAFLSSLAINGLTIVPSGKFFKIRTSQSAIKDSIETYSGAYFPNVDQMITRIVHLKYISASQIQKDLRTLTSKDGLINTYDATNSIIISDYGSIVERISGILQQLDLPGFEEKLVLVPIKYAKAKDISELIDKILDKDDGDNRRRRFSSRSQPSTDNSSVAQYRVISDERTNSLIVVGNELGIKKITRLIRQLDFQISPDDAGGVYVYYVKYRKAKDIAETLSGIAKENKKSDNDSRKSSLRGGGGPPVVEHQIFGGDVKIAADENTNSLVITANKQDYEVVSNILSKIDIPKDQVYVEAIIMEMNLSDVLDWGIGYYKFDEASQGAGRVGFNGLSDISKLINPSSDKGTILGFGDGDTMEITIPTGSGNFEKFEVTSLLGFINLLKTNTKSDILSTPQILALDNEEAFIEVGDKVPTNKTNSTANNITTSGVNYEDATLKMTIKPFISPGSDVLRLEIDQSISQISNKTPPAETLQKEAVILTDRKLKTNVVIKSGNTVVLGGLIRDVQLEAENKVPLLGDIPILGWLFKSYSKKNEKQNLLIFLTPRIVRSPLSKANILAEKLQERKEFVKLSGGREPFGKTISKLQDDVKKVRNDSKNSKNNENNNIIKNIELHSLDSEVVSKESNNNLSGNLEAFNNKKETSNDFKVSDNTNADNDSQILTQEKEENFIEESLDDY